MNAVLSSTRNWTRRRSRAGDRLGSGNRELLLTTELPEAEGNYRFSRRRVGGAAGDPVQCALQASERQDPYGSGNAWADRPGRFGQAEEGAESVGGGGRAGNAADGKS